MLLLVFYTILGVLNWYAFLHILKFYWEGVDIVDKIECFFFCLVPLFGNITFYLVHRREVKGWLTNKTWKEDPSV